LSLLLEGSDVAPRTVTLPPRPLPELLARQLSDREHDPVFHQAMTIAQSLAQAMLNA
ncbi:MAG: hypothetical protein IRY99_21830, partial [Isosphaeraceae bacterium]|nr:hypothetical protein [Isosphaeraceae bacterium]